MDTWIPSFGNCLHTIHSNTDIIELECIVVISYFFLCGRQEALQVDQVVGFGIP